VKKVQFWEDFVLSFMNHSNKVSLAEAIDAFIQEHKLKPQIDAVRVKNVWETLMGKIVAKHTTSVYFKSGKLYLAFDNAALKNEMYFSREKIKTLINNELGEEVVLDVFIY
jgi:hypothetical protein